MDRSGCAGWCGGVWMKAKQPRWSGLYNAGPLGGGARWSQKSASGCSRFAGGHGDLENLTARRSRVISSSR